MSEWANDQTIAFNEKRIKQRTRTIQKFLRRECVNANEKEDGIKRREDEENPTFQYSLFNNVCVPRLYNLFKMRIIISTAS